MTVSPRSRYIAATFVVVETDRGRVFSIYTPPVGFRNTPYSKYVSVEGDTFDLLANQVFGDPTSWWRLADANPQVFQPGVIPPGTILRIPR